MYIEQLQIQKQSRYCKVLVVPLPDASLLTRPQRISGMSRESTYVFQLLPTIMKQNKTKGNT